MSARSGSPRLQIFPDQRRVAQNDGQDVVEVVRHAAGEPADGFHLLRLLELELGALKCALVLNVLDGDRGRVGQRLQQAHFGVGGHAPSRPVVADGADRLCLPNGHHRQTLHERRSIGVGRDARIGVDVFDHRRALVEHGPTADACLERKAHALPQRLDGVLVGIEALVAVAQHEGRAVRPGQASCGAAHDELDVLQGASFGQLLHHADQLLNASNVRLVHHTRSSSCTKNGTSGPGLRAKLQRKSATVTQPSVHAADQPCVRRNQHFFR